jgi:acetyl coenzyme A synthetase (ADP forming)-like protein
MQKLADTLPASDDPTTMRAVLRDGSVTLLKVADSSDGDAVQRFFHELSPESRRRRFFSQAEPPESLVARLCDASDPARTVTLLALRAVEGTVKPIAVASYLSTGNGAAEAAFAVDDRFHGKGLGTTLLERLAAMASARGIDRFEATTLSDNAAMLEVFHESGFEIRSKSERGTIDVQLSLNPTDRTVALAERRMALATAASLRPLLEPATVAVIGASRDPTSIGHRIVAALTATGFTGSIYPINPRAREIAGLPCYASLDQAPHPIDLGVIAVPKDHVLEVVEQCAGAGVKSLVVITAGFAESGEAGRALQGRLLERVRAHGMRMVGPNCMGVLNANPAIRLNASFSPIVPPSGRVGLSSQSGALGMAILDLANERGVGLSTFVSVGNKADVSSNDLLQYWESDPQTSVILLYLESFGNPRRFARLARRIGRVKPIVCVKAGRTRAGSRAAGSHTAALAAIDTAVDALFRQAGVIRAETIDEMFDIAACLEAQPLPRGRRVGIVTNAGGPGILAVDACESSGLQVIPFSETTRAALAAFLPAEASIGNPVDMVASAGPAEFCQAIQAVLRADDVDAVIVIYTPVDRTATQATVQAIRDGIAAGRGGNDPQKPVLACVMADRGHPQQIAVNDEHVPAYVFPENAARALAKIATYAEWRSQPPGLLWGFDDVHADAARAICRTAIAERGETWLIAEETRALLGSFAMPSAAGMLARSADEAAAVAHVIGFPVAAKLAAHGLTHKTEAGGVRLDLLDDAAVRRAFDEIVASGRALGGDASVEGVLVQAMVRGGVETMIGISDDPMFGPVVAFGLGGIHVEILRDIHFRIAPLTDRDADELLHGIRGLPLLQGYRGHAPADFDALRELLLRVSRLAVEVPEIAELDLNPVIALAPGHGCRIVDARVKVHAAR